MAITLAEFEKRLRELGSGALLRSLARHSKAVALKAEHYGKENATTRLRVRTGRLRSSIAGDVRTERAGLEIGLQAGRGGANPVKYARVQEIGTAHLPGGAITPKRSRLLAIPLGPVKTAAGVSRYASPRDVPEPLRFIVSKKGNRLLVNRAGVPYYVLKRSVKIKPKHYLRDGLRRAAAEMPDTLKAVVSSEVRLGVS